MLFIKVRNKKGQPNEYKNSVDLSNPKLLGLILFDLEGFGANIDKAFKSFKDEKEQKFPW